MVQWLGLGVEMMHATSRLKLQEPVHSLLHFPLPYALVTGSLLEAALLARVLG